MCVCNAHTYVSNFAHNIVIDQIADGNLILYNVSHHPWPCLLDYTDCKMRNYSHHTQKFHSLQQTAVIMYMV